MSDDPRPWLRQQLILVGCGAAVWYSGVLLGSDFASGAGVGMLVSALGLRFLRRGD